MNNIRYTLVSQKFIFLFFLTNCQIIFFIFFKIEDEPQEPNDPNDPRNQFSKKSKVSVSVATGLRRDSNMPAVIFIIIFSIFDFRLICYFRQNLKCYQLNQLKIEKYQH